MAIEVRNVVQDALFELGLFSPTTPIPSSDETYALSKLSRLVDTWNAIREAVYTVTFQTFTIVPGLGGTSSPVTIGPDTATFTVVQRPVAIEGANVVLNSGVNAIRIRVDIIDDDHYRAISMPNITATWPTQLYYSPDWPSATDRNGRIFLNPVPTAANGLELWLRVLLAQQGINDLFSMPPGYKDAITLTLAESMLVPYGLAGTPRAAGIEKAAMKARAVIFDLNTAPPSVATQDVGMPRQSSRTRSNWNYHSGLLINR